jgi:flavin-dependent dehydrogenase
MERLGMLPKMKGSHYVKKYSVQFINEHGKLSAPFYFVEHKPQDSSQTWQVMRSEFDRMLLDNARDHGVQVEEGVRVLEVVFEGSRAVGVRIQREDGTEEMVPCQVVVDASGQSTVIQSRMNLRKWDADLKKAAVWTYWEGAYRDVGRDEGATIVAATAGKKGWFWYIPLHDDLISVGIVTDAKQLLKNRENTDLEAIYNEQVELCPGVKSRIAGARRAGPFRVAKEYSYRASQAAGDGWVLVGDAFAFLDPLYSSGVLLALKSGQLAADAVIDGFAKGDLSGSQLGCWEPDYVVGMNRMRRLVLEYYDGLSFGAVIRRYPHLQGLITDLLIGDLFRPELDEVFRCIDEFKRSNSAEAEMAMS